MSATIEFYPKIEDYKHIERLKVFFEHTQGKKIRKGKINNTYVIRKALSYYWRERMSDVVEFERTNRMRWYAPNYKERHNMRH